MKLSDFDFELPPELIAQQPVVPRDGARLLRVDSGNISDHVMLELPKLLRAGDLLVFNDTKVIPARLRGWRGEVAIDITLHRKAGEVWEAFARPARRLKTGDIVEFAPDFTAEVMGRKEDGSVILRFAEEKLAENLEKYGQMPLPPYIRRQEKQASDFDSYQTVFARNAGAVAAPTAGLHFTERLLASLEANDIGCCHITLHVGGGTFLPVKTEDISQHQMHHETIQITEAAAASITRAQIEGRRIVAVGTTSLRSLEAVAAQKGGIEPFDGDTDIFITPGYHFNCVEALITNFHLPKSTLFMLVSAFSGLGEMRKAYAHAIEKSYRFFSYGDACLLERKAA